MQRENTFFINTRCGWSGAYINTALMFIQVQIKTNQYLIPISEISFIALPTVNGNEATITLKEGSLSPTGNIHIDCVIPQYVIETLKKQ